MAHKQEIKDYSEFTQRRKAFAQKVKDQYKDLESPARIILFAGFEDDRTPFRQDSSFYYLTGIEEPGTVLMMDLEGNSILFYPNCYEARSKWMRTPPELDPENAYLLGMEQVTPLGKECAGFSLHPFFGREEYEALLDLLIETIEDGGAIMTLFPKSGPAYSQQRLLLERLQRFVPGIQESIIDVSPILESLRRKKSMRDLERLYQAIDITIMAQEAAAQTIKPGVTEAEVRASLEYIMIGSGARVGFPTIVASGKNSVTLHHYASTDVIQDGDLVVVDIGADFDYYNADITRTYPASGSFTDRQKEIYNLVLETQEYIANTAKPGMWIKNPKEPQKSLHDLAKKYLDDRGYGQYFNHGIGHFLGMDVHDVGDYTKPLQEGDVITIEPGIYIADEKLGVRIEDDYWITKDGAICLSEHLPKTAEEIEQMVQQTFE